MSSESTSSQPPQCIFSPSSKFKFQHHESIIAYNKVVALLEHHEPLFQPMLSFLSNCSICTALTKEPSAMYVEYLKDFWYTVKVDDATKDISFSLSFFNNQLLFTRFDFLSVIGLTNSKNIMPLPPKGIVRVGLATLGLADKDKSSLTSTKLTLSEVSLTSHMLKVAKLLEEPEQSLLPPSGEVNDEESANKEMNPHSTTTHLLETDELVETIIPLQSLEVSISAEVTKKVVEQKEVAEEHSLKIPTVEHLMDKVHKVSQETPESPYDTESKIMVGSYSDLQSMPNDELRSVSGFETVESDNFPDNEVSTSNHIVQDDYASTECISLPDHMDHICEEVSSLHSKLGDFESSIAEIKSSLPTLVNNALKEQLPELLSATLKDYMQSKLQDLKYLLESEVIIDESADQGEQPAEVAMLNEGNALIIHTTKEKKEGLITMEDDCCSQLKIYSLACKDYVTLDKSKITMLETL
ncbi:hypothetical protein Tco_1420957 [Tanacetum coccineum]